MTKLFDHHARSKPEMLLLHALALSSVPVSEIASAI